MVIVDNASNQETRDYLTGAARTFANLNLITNSANLGFARACNQGSRAARGKHLLFLNNDTEVQPGWLPPLVEVMEADAKVGAVGAKLLFPNGTVQHAGVVIINNQMNDIPLTATHICLRGRADDPQANERRACQAVTAACILIRRAAFFQAGGFDEGFLERLRGRGPQFQTRRQRLAAHLRTALRRHPSRDAERAGTDGAL